MKTIIMTKDFKVAEDGVTVETWAEGEVRTTIDQLADDLVSAKVAKFSRKAAPVDAEATAETGEPA